MRIAAVSAALLVVAGSALAASSGTAKPTPAGTLKAEMAAFNAKNYAAAYAGYSAAFKKTCPYAKFRAGQAKLRAMLPVGTTLGVRITGVKKTGARAWLSYQILLSGQVVSTVKAPKTDTFLRVGRLWYDDVDAQTDC